ncbi:MAG: pyridoxal-phosphate dependent enzyme, partial [Flavobacteriales bacterium]
MTAQSLQQVPSGQDIIDAQNRIAPYIHKTPVFTSKAFDAMSNKSCLLKGEHLQKTGAFKARGAMNAVLIHKDSAQVSGFITHSSGNHGAALAWAAGQIGAPAYVVMPSNAPQAKIDAVKEYGGIISFCEPTLKDREHTAAELQNATGALFIHPYDNYDVIAGQATATLELLQEHPDLDWLFIPVGGGGLLAGASLANYYFGKAKVIGCEPSNADDAYQSFNSKTWVPVTKPNTIADGLRTSLGVRNFPIILNHVSDIILLSEEELENAWHICLSRLKQFIEPSAAAGIAAALKHHSTGKAGIILCG